MAIDESSISRTNPHNCRPRGSDSDLVIRASFVIRHSSFVICHGIRHSSFPQGTLLSRVFASTNSSASSPKAASNGHWYKGR